MYGSVCMRQSATDFNGQTARLDLALLAAAARAAARLAAPYLIPSSFLDLPTFLVFDDVRSYPLYYHGASSTFFADIIL